MNLVDISKVPTHTIELSTLLTPWKIVTSMKKNQIESYVYAFIHHKTVMKYGVQYTLGSSVYGERIYRQAFHIPGWPKLASPNSAGNDMLDILENFPNINKNEVSIHVWDMTNYPREYSTDPKYEVNQLERQLIKRHIELIGSRPVGNIKDESHMDRKTMLSDKQFSHWFSHE